MVAHIITQPSGILSLLGVLKFRRMPIIPILYPCRSNRFISMQHKCTSAECSKSSYILSGCTLLGGCRGRVPFIPG